MSERQRPRVALVTDAIYPHFRGGKEVRYHELAQRLARRADVHVFTMDWWGGPPVRQDDQVTFHAVSKLYPMYTGERRSYREAFLFALACLKLLFFRFDIIEADQFPTFHIFALRLVTWLKRKPLTVTWHEVWDRAYWQEYLGAAGNIAYLVQWLAMTAPDQLIAASPETGLRLRETLGPRVKVCVVPNGIDLEAIKDCPPADEHFDLVTVGRLLPHKNVDMLLEAVALLRAGGQPVTGLVIGEGPQRAALQTRAKELGVDDLVEFRANVWERKDLYSLIKAAKIAVFPSAREGFGMAVLEAIACGRPVVTTTAPDNLAQHLVARTAAGLVCDPSAEAVAAAIAKLLADPDPSGQPAVKEAWLDEHGWDFAADAVAQLLGIDPEGPSYDR